MTAPAQRIDQCPGEVHLLVFTVQGVHLAADTSQIEEILEVGEAAARGHRIHPIHEELSFGAGPVSYKAPKVIIIKDRLNPEAAMIDRPDHIAGVTVDSIQGLPPLIAFRPDSSRAIWGALVNHDEVILLLDLFKLPFRKDATAGKSRTGGFHKSTEGS